MKKPLASQIDVEKELLVAMGRLCGGIAHEMNNPIGFCSSNLQSLGKYWEDLQKYLEAVKGLKQSVHRSREEAVAALAAVSRIEQAIDFEFALEDIGEALSETREGLGRLRSLAGSIAALGSVGGLGNGRVLVDEALEKAFRAIHNRLKYTIDFSFDLRASGFLDTDSSRFALLALYCLEDGYESIGGQGKLRFTSGRSAYGFEWTLEGEAKRGCEDLVASSPGFDCESLFELAATIGARVERERESRYLICIQFMDPARKERIG